MPIARRSLASALALGALAAAAPASAQSCRAREIMASQCTWFALEEIGGSLAAAARAQQEATSDLIGGCSPKAYQMILLRGTGLSDEVVSRLRPQGLRDEASVRTQCLAEARRVMAR